MNFQQFKEGKWADYAAMADAVARILELAIPEYDEKIRFQPIQRRAKGHSSLLKKIEDRNTDPKITKKID
jgi:hypothetical protein